MGRILTRPTTPGAAQLLNSRRNPLGDFALTAKASSGLFRGCAGFFLLNDRAIIAQTVTPNRHYGLLTNGIDYKDDGGGRYLACDGTNKYINIAAHPDYNKGSSLTLLAWINFSSGDGAILGRNTVFKFRASSTEVALTYPGHWDQLSSGFNTGVGTWVHVAVTYGNNAVKFYKNGKFVSTHARGGVPETGTLETWIGKSQWGEYFDGKIKQAGFFTRILSEAEIHEVAYNVATYLRPAFDRAFVYSVDSGAITGSGDLVASSAEISGTSSVGHVGTGDLAAVDASISSSGAIAHVGSGALEAGAAVIAGTGALGDDIIGTGDLVATNAELSAGGTLGHSGAGSLVASAASLIGSGSIVYIGSGALEAQQAVISGTGSIKSAITGTGNLVADSARLRGRDVLPTGKCSQCSPVLGLGTAWIST